MSLWAIKKNKPIRIETFALPIAIGIRTFAHLRNFAISQFRNAHFLRKTLPSFIFQFVVTLFGFWRVNKKALQ